MQIHFSLDGKIYNFRKADEIMSLDNIKDLDVETLYGGEPNFYCNNTITINQKSPPIRFKWANWREKGVAVCKAHFVSPEVKMTESPQLIAFILPGVNPNDIEVLREAGYRGKGVAQWSRPLITVVGESEQLLQGKNFLVNDGQNRTSINDIFALAIGHLLPLAAYSMWRVWGEKVFNERK